MVGANMSVRVRDSARWDYIPLTVTPEGFAEYVPVDPKTLADCAERGPDPRACLCPICGGSGIYVAATPHGVHNETSSVPPTRGSHPCHGCGSKGWVRL